MASGKLMDPSRCLESVYTHHTMRQCMNKPKAGGYCAKHRQDLVRRRKVEGSIKRTKRPSPFAEEARSGLRRRLVWDGAFFSALMDRNGVSDRDAAEVAGVSERSIGNYRSGTEPLRHVVRCALASMLGVQPHELFTEAK